MGPDRRGRPVRVVRIVDLPAPDSPNGKQVVTPASRPDWRAWLSAHPDRAEGTWVVYRKRSSDLEGPVYEDLVEEALCFGWIDSVTRRVDDDRMIQWFSPRRRGGIWSRLNKERIERLEREGAMTPAGWAAIERARADGSWSQADDMEALIVPPDLEAAFSENPVARTAYENASNSVKKQMLWTVYSAKRPDTRQRRIDEVIRQLA